MTDHKYKKATSDKHQSRYYFNTLLGTGLTIRFSPLLKIQIFRCHFSTHLLVEWFR